MERCTFCGRESETANTMVVGGYTILDHCTDCEREILENDEIINEHDEMKQLLSLR